MKKVFKTADEEHVAAFYAYGQTDARGSHLYADVECSTYLDAKEVRRAFMNGSLIIVSVTDLEELRPYSCYQPQASGQTLYCVMHHTGNSESYEVAVDPEA